MIKALLLDADGVLINGEMFSKQLERDYGISTKTVEPFFTGPFLDCLIGKADLKKILPPFLDKWGWQKSVDDFLDYWFQAEHKLDEKLIQYIQALRARGIKCYVATNQEKHRAQYMLKQMGFEKSFDKVYASAHIGYKKPDFEFYKKVVKDIGIVTKVEVLFWDDSEKKVAGARKFGILGEVYTSFKDFKSTMLKYLKFT